MDLAAKYVFVSFYGFDQIAMQVLGYPRREITDLSRWNGLLMLVGESYVDSFCGWTLGWVTMGGHYEMSQFS